MKNELLVCKRDINAIGGVEMAELRCVELWNLGLYRSLSEPLHFQRETPAFLDNVYTPPCCSLATM